jgi:hypothetical protein
MRRPDTIQVGDVSLTRVIEWAGPIMTVADILPDTPTEDWQANRSLLAPAFWEPETNAYRCHIQTWVIRAAGHMILVDTGVGNDRDRPQVPPFAHLRTDFLDRLAAADVTPGDVDIVINTHIHYDHVGWNTHLADMAFVPAFPNATYLVTYCTAPCKSCTPTTGAASTSTPPVPGPPAATCLPRRPPAAP